MRRDRKDRGMTFIEVVIAGVILAVILSVAYLVVLSAQDAYASGTSLAKLQNDARIVMGEITDEIRQAGLATINITLVGGAGDQGVTFQNNTGFDGAQIVWSTDIEWSSRMSLNETDNGIDDNGNGIIDEREIVRTQDGDTVAISRWLKEGTMKFTLNGSTLDIEFELERTDTEGRPITVKASASVDIRNQ